MDGNGDDGVRHRLQRPPVHGLQLLALQTVRLNVLAKVACKETEPVSE